eukprot:4313887-Prymnesium_polylepis.1
MSVQAARAQAMSVQAARKDVREWRGVVTQCCSGDGRRSAAGAQEGNAQMVRRWRAGRWLRSIRNQFVAQIH